MPERLTWGIGVSEDDPSRFRFWRVYYAYSAYPGDGTHEWEGPPRLWRWQARIDLWIHRHD